MFCREPASKIMKSQTDLIFDPQLIRKFDINGPRYTSYPTADRFVEAFNAEALRAWLAKRAVGGVSKPLSLYFTSPSVTRSAITAPATRSSPRTTVVQPSI